MRSIPVGDSDCFFVRHLCHVEEFTFHMYFVLSMSLSKKERVNKGEGRIITIVDKLKCCPCCAHAVSIATKAPAKRSQHANATCRNIVEPNMLLAFGHRVATCWVLLAQV